MTPSLPWGLRAYARLLTLYPEDLRREFGTDMMEAFAEDLGAARGVTDALRIWRSALRELMYIAVPAWFETPAVMVPLLSAAVFATSESPLVILAVHRQLQTSALAGGPMLSDVLGGIAIGAAVAALTSFVAVHRWTKESLITLQLG